MPEMSQEEWLEELAAQIQTHGIEAVNFWVRTGDGADIAVNIVDCQFDGNIEVYLEPA